MVASIFYNQGVWHELLSNFIAPYIRQNQSNILHWHLNLSTYRGEHITLVIEARQEDLLQEDFKIQAEAFLENFPSPLKVIDYPLKGLFMDYHNNTLEYNIEASFLSVNNTDLCSIKQQLSEIILQALGSQEIDIESIFTLIVYLQLGIIKAGFTNTKTARVNTLKLVLHLTTQNDSNSDDIADEEESQRFIELFEYNKDVFAEIIDDIWNKQSYEAELNWMVQWENACKEYIQSSEFHIAFMLLSQIAYQQAGLNGDKILLNASKQILKIFNQVTKKMEGIIRIA